MSFKDDLAADLDDVFFNTDEFAEIIDFNGVPIKAIKSKVEKDVYRDITSVRGIAKRLQAVSVKSADMPEKLFIRGVIKVNSEQWIIEDIDELGGITKLVLSAAGGR